MAAILNQNSGEVVDIVQNTNYYAIGYQYFISKSCQSHEMSHIADFQQRRGLYFIELAFMHISKKYMDNFENKTDRRCIQHGLGYQLLSWSKEVREKLKIAQWKGIKGDEKDTRERYMSPESIMKWIDY